MNTGERNVYGRTIWRGPRGGEYTINPLTGRQVRTFTRPTAPTVNTGVPGFTRTRFIAHTYASHHVYKKNSSGRYYAVRVEPNGRPKAPLNAAAIARHINVKNQHTGEIKKLSEFLKTNAAPAAAAPAPTGSPPPSKAVAKLMKLGSNLYMTKSGHPVNRKGLSLWRLSHYNINRMKRQAFAKDPKYMFKTSIPYFNGANISPAILSKLKLKNSDVFAHTNAYPTWKSRVYFNKRGDLHYITLNGRKVPISKSDFWFQLNNKAIRSMKRAIGSVMNNYPRAAIPPNSPTPVRPRRTSPILLNNMMNQIYDGGRGTNINATRYTAEERNVLARRLTSSIEYFKQHRNAKKAEAAEARNLLRHVNGGSVAARQLRARAANANERVGYYDDAVRAYTRGLRAVKPLTGNVTPRARAMAATPNRFTPAPASVEENIIYMPLNRPHLVVKTPGAGGTIYINPETFTGLMRNAARVNIPVANIRNWLRTARRDFPNEPLFRHPKNRSKNVTASHIRFSR